jgi:DNA primase large subunit
MENALIKADADLSRVISFEKRQELYNILHSEDPDHYSRLWLTGFLKFCGYSIEEICAIIHHEASWSDYDDRKTWCQINSVFRSGGHERISSKSRDQRVTSGGILTKCVSSTPCPDSVDGFCFLASGEYHIPSVNEKTRRALNCMMDHQKAKFQRRR